MVQAVQNLPNPFIANVPPLAPRATPLVGDARVFVAEPSAIVSLSADRQAGLVYNPDGTLDASAARFAPELLLLQATGLSTSPGSGAATALPLFPDPTPATLALALDEGFDPDAFDPVAALLGSPAGNALFIPGAPPEPATAAPTVAPDPLATLQDVPTASEPAGTQGGPLFAQPEPAAPPATPAGPTPPTPPEVTAPEPQAVPTAPSTAADIRSQPEPRQEGLREAQAELTRVAEPAATPVTAQTAELLDTLATTAATEVDSGPATITAQTAPISTPLTEADELLAADLQALTQASAETTVATTSQQEQAPTPAVDPALANRATTTGVTPQQAANNPFAPAMAASLYLSAMNFRAQQSSSAGLDNPAEAVQPVGAVRAVSPTFFNREGPADDSRRPGV